MVQGVISRMGQNSFNAKTWAVTVMAAIFAFAPTDGPSKTGLWLALVPFAVFWALDAYYLQQERLFRKLYDGVVVSSVASFTMSPEPYRPDVPFYGAMFATSVWPLHLITIAAVGVKVAFVTGFLRVR
jgi:hypothetical protein